MSLFSLEKQFFSVSDTTRWGIIVLTFLSIAAADFLTPPEYILAYLYAVPILISMAFSRPNVAKALLVIAVIATYLNLFFPINASLIPSIVINRSLAALSIVISSYFMVRYIHYQQHIQAQESLLQSERNVAQMREDFIATLTHDLKTPLLGTEKTILYYLKGSFGAINTEQREVMEAISRSTQRQLALVEDLSSAYRQDTVGVTLRMGLVDMDELMADSLTEVQYLALERKITLEYYCQRIPPKIKGDALQLKRVVANLLHNSLNYTPSGGSIRVNVLEQAKQLLVEMIDSGPGLALGDLENVFHRFYRGEGTREIVGTGLGLYLSRQLIQAHQGTIWVENMPKGGCKFSFTLPTVREEALL
ncbi:MAG: ATP-binding protein [Vampirovibrionales bacterium]|nr:ATP-binding protein [Vampirovibrionales bacterium]